MNGKTKNIARTLALLMALLLLSFPTMPFAQPPGASRIALAAPALAAEETYSSNAITDATPDSPATDPGMKFPWDRSENPWQLTTGPHDWGQNTGTQSGLDFDKDNTPRRVLAMFEGDVVAVGSEACGGGQYNSTVRVRASNGSRLEIWYLHLSSYNVQVGDHVLQGGYIGMSGNLGCSVGVHIHVELVRDGSHLSW